MTLDNLPAGNYTVRIKRSGWPDYVQQVTVQPNTLVAVEHTFKGVSVTLKSDPAGATIFAGATELGQHAANHRAPTRTGGVGVSNWGSGAGLTRGGARSERHQRRRVQA